MIIDAIDFQEFGQTQTTQEMSNFLQRTEYALDLQSHTLSLTPC